MHNLGFTVGTLVASRKSTDMRDDQYMITCVNEDGSVGLNRVQPDGSIATAEVRVVAMDDAVATLHALNVTSKLKLDDRLTMKQSARPFDDVITSVASMVLRNTMQSDYDSFRFQLQPVRRLIAMCAAKTGKLALTPVGRPSLMADGGTLAPTNVCLTVGLSGRQYRVTVSKLDNKTHFTPYFAVQATRDKAKINMEVEDREIELSVKTPKRESATVKVPMLVNCKPAAPDDELLVWHNTTPKTEKRSQQLVLSNDHKDAKQPKLIGDHRLNRGYRTV